MPLVLLLIKPAALTVCMEISLEQLLESRDNRHKRQMELLDRHPSLTLVCLTVIPPGKIKRNRESLIVAKAAVEAIKETFYTSGTETYPFEEYDLETGYEAYFMTTLSTTEAKRLACKIEDEHPLGRLFDIDIIGNQGVPMNRESIGFSPRRCLLCSNEARFCMRNHTHTQAELITRIQEMVSAYVQ